MKKAILILILFCVNSLFSQVNMELQFSEDAENLGVNVNSSYSEINPKVSPDGKTLYFSRGYHPQNIGGESDEEDIWYSILNDDATWSVAQRFPTPLNNADNNSIHSITPDGNTILLMNVYNYFDGSMSNGTSLAYRSRGGWTFPKKQNIVKYNNRSDFVSYFLTNDGKAIIMSIETKKSLGERDLYVSFKTGENEWSKPQNLGDIVNTREDDGSPFLAADGVTLYYSTSGHKGGYGDNDIWKVKRLDNTWKNWSEPVNMGPKINSPDWDSYFTIPASGEYAYFVSYENSNGKADIFRIKLPAEAKPDPVVLISGNVYDSKTKKPIMTKIIYELLPEGKEVGIARSDPEKGAYKIVLPFGERYGFLAKADGYYAVSDNIDVTELEAYKEVVRDLYLTPIKKMELGEVVLLKNIFFEFGKTNLKEESYPELKRVVKLLSENTNIQIEISGHTDDVGAEEKNLELSQGRAQAVVDYLILNGVKGNRLIAKGYGEIVPVATNKTEEGKALNRRVEFKLLKN